VRQPVVGVADGDHVVHPQPPDPVDQPAGDGGAVATPRLGVQQPGGGGQHHGDVDLARHPALLGLVLRAGAAPAHPGSHGQDADARPTPPAGVSGQHVPRGGWVLAADHAGRVDQQRHRAAQVGRRGHRLPRAHLGVGGLQAGGGRPGHRDGGPERRQVDAPEPVDAHHRRLPGMPLCGVQQGRVLDRADHQVRADAPSSVQQTEQAELAGQGG